MERKITVSIVFILTIFASGCLPLCRLVVKIEEYIEFKGFPSTNYPVSIVSLPNGDYLVTIVKCKTEWKEGRRWERYEVKYAVFKPKWEGEVYSYSEFLKTAKTIKEGESAHMEQIGRFLFFKGWGRLLPGNQIIVANDYKIVILPEGRIIEFEVITEGCSLDIDQPTVYQMHSNSHEIALLVERTITKNNKNRSYISRIDVNVDKGKARIKQLASVSSLDPSKWCSIERKFFSFYYRGFSKQWLRYKGLVIAYEAHENEETGDKVFFIRGDEAAGCELPSDYFPPIFPYDKNAIGLICVTDEAIEARIFKIETSSAKKAVESLKQALARKPEKIIKIVDLLNPYSNFSAAYTFGGKRFRYWREIHIYPLCDENQTILHLTVVHEKQPFPKRFPFSRWFIDLHSDNPHPYLLSTGYTRYPPCLLSVGCDYKCISGKRALYLDIGEKIYRLCLGSYKESR